MSQLRVENVTKEFATRSDPLVVLKGCSLELSAGESLAILGPSGSGKSTLLQIIGTLDRPTSGRVLLGGADPFALDEPRLADFRNRQIGFIFQDHYLLPQCSVIENVLVPTIATGGATADDVSRARRLIDRVGLGSRLEHRPAELSGGERQRVSIARALILRPELVLADEPTGNLDRTTAASIGDLLVELQSTENTMMIVVTHSHALAERFGRQLEIDDGQLRASRGSETAGVVRDGVAQDTVGGS
jgi:lipoprotein-releasing system ATP-binding protein